VLSSYCLVQSKHTRIADRKSSRFPAVRIELDRAGHAH
jgi:hypothetical protein